MKYWIYINSYFVGGLNNDESIQFELEMTTNSELRKEVELVLSVYDLLEKMVMDFDSNPAHTIGDEFSLSILYAVYGINCNTGEILPTEDDLISDIPKEYTRGQKKRIKLNCQMLPVDKTGNKECLMLKNIYACLTLLLLILKKITYILNPHAQWYHHQSLVMVI